MVKEPNFQKVPLCAEKLVPEDPPVYTVHRREAGMVLDLRYLGDVSHVKIPRRVVGHRPIIDIRNLTCSVKGSLLSLQLYI